MYFILTSLLNLFSIITISKGLRCYQCGTEAIYMDKQSADYIHKSEGDDLENTLLTVESCSNIEFSFSSWGPYAVDCGPEQICMKTIIDEGFDEKGIHHYATGSRGCAMSNNSLGQTHEMGCGILTSKIVPLTLTETHQTKWDLVCFCNDDYCNGAQRTGAFVLLTTGLLSLLSIL